MAEELKLNFTRQQWACCEPKFMSPAAVMHAMQRAKQDIESLHRYAETLSNKLLSQWGDAVAWQAGFIESGDALDAWETCSKEHHDLVKRCPNEWPGYEVRALYTHPADQVAEPGAVAVQLLAAFPLFDDANLSESTHHCEWHILQERKRLHAMLDRLLAKSEGVKP
jgi:hypothetical protein